LFDREYFVSRYLADDESVARCEDGDAAQNPCHAEVSSAKPTPQADYPQ
jgi:hypothetical protein